MKRSSTLGFSFVEFIPSTITANTIYISTTYGTAVHKCCCGCGKEVVTPLTPTDWSLTYDGDTVSLHPSIGNWDYECRSHYIIRRNLVIWANEWSEEAVKSGKTQDQQRKAQYYSERTDGRTVASMKQAPSILARVKSFAVRIFKQ